MTTERIQNFWRPLAIFLFVALIGVVVWMVFSSAPPDDHQGNTEMGDDNGGGGKNESWCINRNVTDKSKATLYYWGDYTYHGDLLSSGLEILIQPELYEGSTPVSPTNLSYSVTSSVGTVSTVSPGVFLLSDCPVVSGISNCKFNIEINISNINFNAHEYRVDFRFPNGGAFHPPNPENPAPDHLEIKSFMAKVCEISDPENLPTSGNLPRMILSTLSGTLPNIPIDNDPKAEWPKYEIINNEGVITLIPYFEEDFNKENQE